MAEPSSPLGSLRVGQVRFEGMRQQATRDEGKASPTSRSGDGGFALSEFVLVAVVVVALLVVAISSVRGIRRDTMASDCQTQLRNLKVATEQYQAERGVYPASQDQLLDDGYLEAGTVTGWRVEFGASGQSPAYEPVGSSCS